MASKFQIINQNHEFLEFGGSLYMNRDVSQSIDQAQEKVLNLRSQAKPQEILKDQA